MPNFLRYLRFQRMQSIKAASALLAITALLSNGLGLLRNLIFYRLIAPDQLDIYYASFRIPDFLFNLIIFGAMSNAFVPILTELFTKKEQEHGWKVTNQVLSWLTIVFIGLAILIALAMRPIMHAMVPGFEPARFETTVLLSRLMLFQTVIFAWSFTFGGLLNSSRRFSSYALAPLLYNIAIIIGGLLAPRYGIISITVSVIIGALLHLGIQYKEAISTGYRPRFTLEASRELKEIITLMIPRSLSQGMGQLVLIVYTTLASTLQAGSIAIYSGMNDLQTTPVVIIANSLAVAFFPVIASRITEKDWDGMNALLTKVTRTALFLLLPTLMLSFILRAQVVRLYFGIGGASWPLTNLAIETFVWLFIGIVPASLVVLYAKVFYAFKDTRTPMVVSLIAGIVSIAVAVIGIRQFGGTVATLGIAATTLSFVQCILFLIVLYRHDHIRLELDSLVARTFSYGLGALFSGFTTWGTLRLVDHFYRQTNFLGTHIVTGLFLQMLLAAAVGVLTYLGYSMIVHREEIQWLKRKRFSNSQ